MTASVWNTPISFFSTFHALTVDDGGGRTDFSPLVLAALHIKRMMDTIQRAVATFPWRDC
jgi:hypothetical protein